MHQTPWHYATRVSPTLRIRQTRLRAVWFMLGTLFGVGLGSLFYSPPSSPDSQDISIKNAIGIPEEGIRIETVQRTGEPEAPPAPAWPREVELRITSGDRLIDLLQEQGISREAAYRTVETLKPEFNPRKLRVGHTLQLTLDADPTRVQEDGVVLKRLEIILSAMQQVELWSDPDGTLHARMVEKPVVARPEYAHSTIDDSLYMTAKRQDVPDGTIVNLIRAFSYDVDFQRDIRQGDEIELLYEKIFTEDDVFVEPGNVLYAELKTRGRSLKIYRYEKTDGTTQFYNEKGESVKKALLRTPIDGARISSRFGRRKHPILGYTKMHKGLDFAAPRGTPIYAGGDGKVTFAGRKGGYGNYVKLRHNSTYSTAYAHVKSFARGIRKGRKVRQGQVIAYVGTTGRSTGPHLHYEILKRGKHVNPAKVTFTGSDTLKGKELKRFKATMQRYRTTMAKLKDAPEKIAAAPEES